MHHGFRLYAIWNLDHSVLENTPLDTRGVFFFCTCHTKSEQLYCSDMPISPSANIFSFFRALPGTCFVTVSRSNRAPRRALLDCTSLHFPAHPYTIMPDQRSYTSVVPGQKVAVTDYRSEGWGFESLRARQISAGHRV